MNLTPREYEVARLFALGRTWEQVMADMDCSRAALHQLRSRAMQKVKVGTMQELWVALGWLRAPEKRDRESFRGAPGSAEQPAPSLRKVG